MRLRPDATYLVVGGFGALGTALVARWMVEHGARRLILMGRTELSPRSGWHDIDPETDAGRRVGLVRELEQMGAAVHVAAIDVADEAALAAYLTTFTAEGWPAIRGVVHAAASFGTGLVHELDPVALWAEARAKVAGAWTLSELLDDLDLFVLFSSVASVLPQPGQGAYAAANAFLDALARSRAATGRSALSVDWGVWSDAGEPGRGERWERRFAQLEAQGQRGFTARQGLDALGRLVQGTEAQAVFAPVDWAAYAAARPSRSVAFVADLVAERRATAVITTGPTSTTRRLTDAAPADRLQIMEDSVRRLAGRVLKLAEARIDARQPLGALGLDSLMAIDLRNRLEADVGLPLSATLTWNHPTVADIAAHLLDRLDLAPSQEPVPTGSTAADPAPITGGDGESSSVQQIVASVRGLDDDEVLRQLMGGSQP